MRFYILLIICSLFNFSLSFGQLIKLPPKPALPEEGISLIIEFEVGGGESYYNRFLRYPTVPGGLSGVTIGIGADLGAGYSDPKVFLFDFSKLDIISATRLAPAVGLNHSASLKFLPKVKDILISWDIAKGVFDDVTITRYYYLAKRTYPGFEDLDPRAQAALTSLIFNRGSSLIGPKREEMRRIKELIPKKDYKGIANQVRKMKRIWTDTDIEAGMYRRREAEAVLIESSINP